LTISKARPITVTSRMLTRASATENNTYLLECRQCGNGFKLGQEIVTKKNRNRTRWYHKECAIKLNIWWEDGT
jgi:hypothetical protein